MTTIITRLFPDNAAAQSAAERLQFKGIPKKECDVIVAGPNAKAEMVAAQVHETAIAPYAAKVKDGAAVLVVRTTYKPLGAARLTRDILDALDPIEIDGITDDFFVRNVTSNSRSVLEDHPHMLTLPGYEKRGLITAGMGMRMLKPHRTKRALMSHDKRMSRMFWPAPLLSKKTRSSSVMHGTRHMSKKFWPGPLLMSRTPRRKSVITGGGFPFSRLLGLQTTS